MLDSLGTRRSQFPVRAYMVIESHTAPSTGQSSNVNWMHENLF